MPRSLRKARGKAVFVGISLVGLWLLCAAVLRGGGCVSPSTQMWIELANGATWPTHWREICSASPGHFALLLAARSTLDFAGPLTVVVTGVWIVTGGLERLMQMSRHEVMRMLSAEIVTSLATYMRSKHGTFKSEQEIETMQQIADKVVDSYLADVVRLEQRDGQMTR